MPLLMLLFIVFAIVSSCLDKRGRYGTSSSGSGYSYAPVPTPPPPPWSFASERWLAERAAAERRGAPSFPPSGIPYGSIPLPGAYWLAPDGSVREAGGALLSEASVPPGLRASLQAAPAHVGAASVVPPSALGAAAPAATPVAAPWDWREPPFPTAVREVRRVRTDLDSIERMPLNPAALGRGPSTDLQDIIPSLEPVRE